MTFFEWLKRRFSDFKFYFTPDFEVLLAAALMAGGGILFVIGVPLQNLLITILAFVLGVPGYLMYLHACFREEMRGY